MINTKSSCPTSQGTSRCGRAIVQIVSIALLTTPLLGSAAGLGVSTAKLEITAWDFFPAEAKFTVSNPNPYHIGIGLNVEGSGSTWVNLSERNLVLSAGEQKEVTVRVSARRGGLFEPKILIQEIALEGDEIAVGTGIRLPLSIESRAVWGPLAAALATLLFFIAYRILRKKQR